MSRNVGITFPPFPKPKRRLEGYKPGSEFEVDTHHGPICPRKAKGLTLRGRDRGSVCCLNGSDHETVFVCCWSVKQPGIETHRWQLVAVLQSSELPQRLAGTNNTWNCSVRHWPRFQRHFRCNMRQECAHGEDETECPYSYCSHGGVRIDRHCYFYVVNDVGLTCREAQRECGLMGANLASLTSLGSWNGVMTWLHLHSLWKDGDTYTNIGLTSAQPALPYMWVDDGLVQPADRVNTDILFCF